MSSKKNGIQFLPEQKNQTEATPLNRLPTEQEVRDELGITDPNVVVRVIPMGEGETVTDVLSRILGGSDAPTLVTGNSGSEDPYSALAKDTNVEIDTQPPVALSTPYGPYVRKSSWTPQKAAVVEITFEVFKEVLRAIAKHAPMHSPHEGYAVIKEELEELWDEVKADKGLASYARKEAIQVAAMAVRYILDLKPAKPLFTEELNPLNRQR